ncbi:uncharacterized protein LOC121413279 [Lytechinus variegatus]|uniref:uncharacterized protein LOC121413256 n=1 Tax=Lytechinus variegatus TaxID=7654 RepID=UPI001BB26BF1|nr:uncharacterized protein LOC121413256 [Lytechinus variegatus]XP_041461980.1 uncharacterized protein LOC121413279 [Lytechinus variegatus]
MKRGSWILSFGSEEGKRSHGALSTNVSTLQNRYSGYGVISRYLGENKTEIMAESEERGTEAVSDQPDQTDRDKRDISRADSVESAIDQHLKKVELQVIAATEKELSQAEADRYKMATLINQETERDIRRLYEKRDERLRKNHQETEKKRQMIVEKRFELVEQIHSLGDEIMKTANKLKIKHHDMGFSKSSSSPKLHAKLAKKLSGHHHKNGGDSSSKNKQSCAGIEGLAKLVHEIAFGISFMKLEGAKVGQISGNTDRWVLEEKIEVGPMVGLPALKGAISGSEVVVEDVKTSFVYVTNIEDKTTRAVIGEKYPMFNCASHDGTVIVCGGRSGKVALYDRSWGHLRNLSLPEKFLSGAEVMCVAVDGSARILIAQYGGNTIHVFNPSGTQWIKTIEIEEMVPIHGIHVLQSGIAVHSAMYGEQVCIVDKDGKVKANVFLEESEEKCMSILSTDPVSNALFNLTCNSTSGQCVVEELCDVKSGHAKPEKIIEFDAPRLANGLIAGEGFSVLRPDKMVTCDGEQLLVYGKRKGVHHLRHIISESNTINKGDRD